MLSVRSLGFSTSCSATFRQLLVFRATFFFSCNFWHFNFSSYLLILWYRSISWCLNWPLFHISQYFVDNLWISSKKGDKSFSPGAHYGRRIAQRCLQKILNGWQLKDSNSQLTWVSRVKKVIKQFFWLITFLSWF